MSEEQIKDSESGAGSAPSSRQCYTAGPWRVGRRGSCVVADQPTPEIAGSDDVEYYGGHLICESVSQANAKLIAVAPEMRELLETIEKYEDQLPPWLWVRIQDVLARSV